MKHSPAPPIKFPGIFHRINYSRSRLFGLLIIAALLAFELFNYSTTDFALNDLLGGLRFMGLRWATILAIAFCGIDFAGIARLFTPISEPYDASEAGIARLFTPVREPYDAGEAERARRVTSNGVKNESRAVWYLFGAWLLAATMNAMLTWWGVALAILNHQSLGNSVIDREILVNIVPVFVAAMVWLIRVLIIGTLSVAGERLYLPDKLSHSSPAVPVMARKSLVAKPVQSAPVNFRPLPKATSPSDHRSNPRPDPAYHPAGMSANKARADHVRH